ncbi:SMC family ATPase [Paenibacillus spiritus]|uniref:Nuclease SbcCD subunit C n=1 Tax=Paenibacillus spiritus TaxID=2496557 RepID=A0A5J5G8Q4_9BACL|nr:SMC family ATPase [Paenibacillus spiritus]KAA9003924.1 SMC family ATPase [Paenibacillus spiritus]
MRIAFLEIESFRGYGEKYSFSFPDSNVILLYGQNGNGKTSFFDAIEWCLTGSISRYEIASDERRRTKFIGNKFSNNIPQVNLVLSVNNHKIHIFRYGRSFGKLTDYGQENTRLKVVINDSKTFYDSEAEQLLSILLINEHWRSRINLQRGLSLTNILGQEQMDSLIRGIKDKDRYDNLSVLFGTQHFQNKYNNAFQEIKKIIVSKNEENQKALKIIEELLGQLKLELQKNDITIPDNISENLKESYIRQQKKIKNLDISNQSIPEVQFIKSNLAKDQTYVNNYLTTHENTWNKTINAIYAFERWEKQQPRLIKLLELQSIVRKIEFEQRKEKEITWLTENSVRFFETENKLMALNTSLEAKKRESKKLEFSISILSESQQQTLAKNTVLQSSININEESFNSEDLVSQLQTLDISYELSFQIQMILDKLRTSLLKQRDLEQRSIDYSKELKENENLLKQIQDLDNNYHQLLISIQNYAKNNPDVSTCPACGTNNISSNHLLAHTLNQQNTSHPDLNRLSTIVEDSKLSYAKIEKEIIEIKNDYTIYLLEFKRIIDELTKLIDSVHQSLLFTNKECELLQKEIDFLREFNSDFIEKSKNLKFEIEETNISNLKELLNDSLSRIVINKANLAQTQNNLLRSCELDNTNEIDIIVSNVKKNQEVLFDSFRDIFEINSIDDIDDSLSISFNTKIEELKLEKKKIDNWKTANDELSISIKQMEAFEHSKSLKTQIDINEKKQLNLINNRTKLKKDLEVIEAAIKATPITIDKLNENVMDELFDDISKIYQRISPHPLFTNFKYDKNKNFKANRLLYNVSENDGNFANPSFIFSSAQVNGSALSIFLAMAMKQEWTPLSLIAMDDPIQSMDDLNTSFLVDFIRELTKHSTAKQFIISTHDINFYRLMLKKFRYQNLSTLEFEGLTKAGPILTMNSGKFIRTHSSQSLSKGKLELNKLFEDILKDDEEDIIHK